MIKDQFTNLNVSRQRKWQLRHPAAFQILKQRYEATEKGKATARRYMATFRKNLPSRVYQREYQRDLNYWFRRYLNAKSYQDERRSYLSLP